MKPIKYRVHQDKVDTKTHQIMKTKIILFALLLSPTLFFAWGSEGHHIVAELAKNSLNKGVEQQVQRYLGSSTFEQAAVWMDEMRPNHSYDYMKPWHYTNFEKGATYAKAANGDIVSELQLVISELKNYKKLKDEDVNKDLKILFHLCGDLAMPLHAGYASDKDGVDFPVKCFALQTNLHWVWDSVIISQENITIESCLKAENKLTEEQKKLIAKMDVLSWMYDSRALVPLVYNFKGTIITQEYLDANKEQVEIQLAKGGLMLASVLNEVFKN